MSSDSGKIRRNWKRFRIVAAVLLVMYLLLGVFVVGQAWADAQSSDNALIPTPLVTNMRPPTGAADSVVENYYDYLQVQTYATLGEKYVFDLNSFLIMYAVLGINIGGIYVFVHSWYSARLRKNDLYPIEVYGGYIAERGGPFDILNYYLWTLMFIYILVYVVITMIFGQLY